ncbi:hypothetical protein NEOLI_002564 [Neolecta irregularis DAH-3]|uniref:Uncharacterized protein n=1 Tax=Neolecta irregularis (strain DAH-3) TaxID=1198029 RepID=A0A1U7LPH3_NEOID|nr:hypothetical protein NEOLI_002564 [Neolecta irregularis DAH-3]|eukprot:OLL24566.1 hypothetical protein NEOLI_002564 [Neolecta irregularis DAH-3]
MLLELLLFPLVLADLDSAVANSGFPTSQSYPMDKIYHPYNGETSIRTVCHTVHLQDRPFIKLSVISNGVRLVDRFFPCEGEEKCISIEHGLATCINKDSATTTIQTDLTQTKIGREMYVLEQVTKKYPHEALLFLPFSANVLVSAIYCSRNQAKISYALRGIVVNDPLVRRCQHGCEPGYLHNASGGCSSESSGTRKYFTDLLSQKTYMAAFRGAPDSTGLSELLASTKELSGRHNHHTDAANDSDGDNSDAQAWDDSDDLEFEMLYQDLDSDEYSRHYVR